jgi:hypothetical protein
VYDPHVSSWGCPHEVDGVCQRVRGALCDPGMLGCVVQGRVEVQGEPRGPRQPVRAQLRREEREVGTREDSE